MKFDLLARAAFVFGALSAASTASAANCDGYLAKISTAKGSALVDAYQGLVRCDANLGRSEFGKYAMVAGNLETLVPLTLAGVDATAYGSVWETMGKIPYEYRTDLAHAVGAACEKHPKLVEFFRTSYVGQKGTEFSSWQSALTACGSADMAAWVDSIVLDPPTSNYNDRYNAVLGAVIESRHGAALPLLQKAAITAGTRGGPFNNLLDVIQRSVEVTGYGKQTSPEDRAAMVNALVAVAKAVPPESARAVADRLLNAGDEGMASSLLPAIYPDRVQSGGGMMWAGAAIEACDGEAVIHWVSFTEAPKRLSVLDAVAVPLRAAKAKLKCPADTAWTIRATDAPVKDRGAAQDWVDTLVAELDAKGTKAKLKEEAVTIP